MASSWFVRRGEKVYGPFDAGKLKRLAAERKIDDLTEVAANPSGPWHPAGKLKGLFPKSAAPGEASAKQPQGSVLVTADQAVKASPADHSSESSVDRGSKDFESFTSWYRRSIGSWNFALQILLWLCGGYVFIPVWWALDGNKSQLGFAKLFGLIFAGLLVLLAAGKTWELIDPEGVKRFREKNAQAAAERREKAREEKNKKSNVKGAHLAAGLVAIEMKNKGRIRPRGEVLDALARKAANELKVPYDERDQFVRDFEWAFNLAWDKSR